MASPFTVTPVLGIDLNTITLAADVGSTSGAEDAPQLGTQVFGSDGRRYVYGQAGATITASTTVCLPSATTFIVAATGGTYRSPAVAMATGDRGFFSVASV
jgi:hypothetical protein